MLLPTLREQLASCKSCANTTPTLWTVALNVTHGTRPKFTLLTADQIQQLPNSCDVP